MFTDEKDLHVESLDSGGTSTVPSEVVASVQPEDEQGLLSLQSSVDIRHIFTLITENSVD